MSCKPMDMTSRQNQSKGSNGRAFAPAIALLASLLFVSSIGATATEENAPAVGTHTLEREGLKVNFEALPTLALRAGERPLREGDHALMRFTITDATSGKPVEGLYPGAWMDLSGGDAQEKNSLLSCKERISLYLGGATGMRPLLDMNSYFILALNEDATISVIDPAMLVAGVPDNFYTQVVLPRPGADWVKSDDDKQIYVSIPQSDVVAVVDTVKFELTDQIKTGVNPVRLVMQPGGRYLWVGNDGKGREAGGISVIDLTTRTEVSRIETGAGHHEITFAQDGRLALVTNREAGTASIIDVDQRIKLRDVTVGKVPISAGYSALSNHLYVADGHSGQVVVIDHTGDRIIDRIELAPGLGPMRFTPEGRWGFVVNPSTDSVYVIDAATNRLAHTVPVSGKPFSLSLSRNFAYVRALASTQVSMINLSELGGDKLPPINRFSTGTVAPERARSLSIADGVAPSPVEAGVVVVNPGDSHLYFYMEGMNFPRGSFRSYAHRPQAVQIVDRALVEETPGVYQSEVKIPVSGDYDVAFIMEAPRIMHCFSVHADANPELALARGKYQIEYLNEQRNVAAGEEVPVRFRLLAPNTREPVTGLEDVRVRYFLAPNRGRTEVSAQEVEPGVYQAGVNIPQHGAYYVYVAAASRELKFADLPYLTLMSTDPARYSASKGKSKR